jgi:hypothetical protein
VRLTEQFRAAVRASEDQLPGLELLPDRLARACAAVLPVTGAGISFMYGERRLPLGASDDAAAEAERLQFTIGEGPCLAAHASGLPVHADDETLQRSWPAFYDTLAARTPIRGIIAIPLRHGLRGVGALDLYVTASSEIGRVSLVDALTISDEIVRAFDEANQLRSRLGDGPIWLDAPGVEQRAVVWMAMGFLNSALGINSADALALLRAHAYSSDQTLDEVAALVIDRELPLSEFAVDAAD